MFNQFWGKKNNVKHQFVLIQIENDKPITAWSFGKKEEALKKKAEFESRMNPMVVTAYAIVPLNNF